MHCWYFYIEWILFEVVEPAENARVINVCSLSVCVVLKQMKWKSLLELYITTCNEDNKKKLHEKKTIKWHQAEQLNSNFWSTLAWYIEKNSVDDVFHCNILGVVEEFFLST